MKSCVILSDFHWCNKYFDSPASKVIDLIFQPFCITGNTEKDIRSSCEPSFHLQNIFIQYKNCVMIFFTIPSFLSSPLFPFLIVLALLLNWQFPLYLIIQISQELVGIELILPSSLYHSLHTYYTVSFLACSFLFFLGFSLHYSLKRKTFIVKVRETVITKRNR